MDTGPPKFMVRDIRDDCAMSRGRDGKAGFDIA